MKNGKGLIGGFVLLIVAASAVLALPSRQESPDRQPDELKKQVASLEQRVDVLEKQIEKLALAIPQSFPNLPQLPKGWEKREFNGLNYYIIPIEQTLPRDKAKIR